MTSQPRYLVSRSFFSSFFLPQFLFVFISLLSASFAFAENIDSLLNEANQALGKQTPKNDSASGEEKKKSNAKRRPQPSPSRVQEAPVPAKAETNLPPAKTPSAESAAAVRRVLEIDAAQEEAAQLRASNGYDANLSLCLLRLGNLYKLQKEEDSFVPVTKNNLFGLYGQLYLPASVFALQEPRKLLLGIGVGVGAFQGNVNVRRTGVTNGVFPYQFLIVPVDAVVRVETKLTENFRLRLHYGPATEIVNQNGNGQTDTTTAFVWGETAGVTGAYQAGKNLRAQIFAARRGPLLLWKQKEISGWMLGLGVAVMFAG